MKYNAITIGDPAGIGPEISIKVLVENEEYLNNTIIIGLSLIHISEPTRLQRSSRMPSSA